MNSPYTTRPLLGDDDDDDDDEEDGDEAEKKKAKAKEVPEFLGKSLLDQRVIMVSKPVDRDMAAAIVGQLLVLDHKDSKAPITMYVNCPGGDADSGFGIYDAMRFITAPVTTVCLGLAASAAVIIFVGGAKGRRFTLPHSRFLIHQPSSMSQGQASDIEITANEIIKTRDLYNQILSDETGRPDKQILKDVSRDFWLSAKEAVDYGIASSILASKAQLA
jgi:ATP-dependent Clp protease, protease subunit